MSVTKVSSPMIESGTKGADIASAATVVIGTDGSYFDITGTTGISTQFTVDAGRRFTLQFDDAVTITDNAAITLSGAANFTTAAGDILSFVATAANTVVQTGYSLVDGGSPVSSSSGLNFISKVTASNDATVDFLSSFSVTYDTYLFTWHSTQPITDAESLAFRVAQGGGAETDSTYTRAVLGRNDSGSTHHNSATNNNVIYLTGTGVGNASVDEHSSGNLWVYNPLSSAVTGILFQTWVNNQGNEVYTYYAAGSYHGNNTALTGGQFLYSSGNISNGEFLLYGLAKS